MRGIVVESYRVQHYFGDSPFPEIREQVIGSVKLESGYIPCRQCGVFYDPKESTKGISVSPLLANQYCSRKCFDRVNTNTPTPSWWKVMLKKLINIEIWRRYI